MKLFNSRLLIFCSIFFFVLSSITNSSAQTLMNKLADETCAEMNKLEDDLSPKEIEQKMETIMGTILITNFEKISKEYDITLESIEKEDKAFNDFSEKLAMELFTSCPKFMEIILLLPDDEVEAENSPSQTIEGKIIDVEGDDFTYVKVKEDNGRVKKLFWGRPFDGDNLLMNNNKLKGKEVTITYSEKECYNAKLKDYNTLREITSLELKE